MRPPHTQIIIFHNEPPFHSCIYYIVIDDEYQKFKLITSSSNSDLSLPYYIINFPIFQPLLLTFRHALVGVLQNILQDIAFFHTNAAEAFRKFAVMALGTMIPVYPFFRGCNFL